MSRSRSSGRLIRIVAAATAAALLAGCGSGDAASDAADGSASRPRPGPETTLGGASRAGDTPTTSTTAPPQADVYAVPPVLGHEYLERVLAALDAVDGDAARLIVGAGAVTGEARARLQAVYAPQELDDQLALWEEELRDGVDGFRDPPGNRRTRVVRTITAGGGCVYAEVEEDLSAVATDPGPPSRSFVALEPKDPSLDPAGFNVTPWVVAFSGYDPDRPEPANPCPR